MRSVTLTGVGGGAGYAPSPSPAPSGQGRRNAGRGLRVPQDVFHLYVLLGVELLLTIALRAWSRNHHGG